MRCRLEACQGAGHGNLWIPGFRIMMLQAFVGWDGSPDIHLASSPKREFHAYFFGFYRNLKPCLVGAWLLGPRPLFCMFALNPVGFRIRTFQTLSRAAGVGTSDYSLRAGDLRAHLMKSRGLKLYAGTPPWLYEAHRMPRGLHNIRSGP